MADKKERKNRVITQNVKSFEECEDLDEARSTKGSIRASGLNYYMKRKVNLVPVAVVVKIGDEVGVLCTAIAAE